MKEIFNQINKPLGIRTLPLSYEEYTKACYELFCDEKTLVFVDTNILGLPFRFHSSARNGFYALLSMASSQKRLVVPGWASNEFFHRAFRSSGAAHGFSSSVGKQLGNTPSADNVRKILSRVLSDDEISNYSSHNNVDRNEVVSDLAQRIDNWNKDIERLGKDLDAEFIHGELLGALDGCFRSLDFAAHCRLVEGHADRRRANRIPPGLTDAKKGDSNSRGASVGNVDGDLALWLEILRLAKQETMPRTDIEATGIRYDHVVILCEERKDDFLYAPSSRQRELSERNYQPKPTKNDLPTIKIPDPRLVSEFESVVGHRSLAFVTMEELARGSMGAKPDRSVRHFIEALTQEKDTRVWQRGDGTRDGALEIPPVQEGSRGQEPSIETAVSTPSVLAIPECAMNDEKAYIEGIPSGTEKEILTQINTHNWYVQNPAILELRMSRIPSDLGTAFVLGRAVYQAADGSAWRASEFLRGFDEWVTEPTESEQAFVAGAAYEMLFTGKGVLRDVPKARAIELVLDMLAIPRWAPAWKFLESELLKAGRAVVWRPGEPLPSIRLEIVQRENQGKHEVLDIFLFIDGRQSVSLRATSLNDPRMIKAFRIKALREDVAEILLVREGDISIEVKPPCEGEARLTFPFERLFSLSPVVNMISQHE